MQYLRFLSQISLNHIRVTCWTPQPGLEKFHCNRYLMKQAEKKVKSRFECSRKMTDYVKTKKGQEKVIRRVGREYNIYLIRLERLF